jgi:hypothetical protein
MGEPCPKCGALPCDQAIGAGELEVPFELQELAAALNDELLVRVRTMLEEGQTLSRADQRLLVEQCIKDRKRAGRPTLNESNAHD